MWRDFPLVNYALYAVGIAHAEISNLPIQRLDLVFTAVFPMLVPWVVYGLRWTEAPQRQRRLALAIGLEVPLLIAINLMVGSRVVLERETLRVIYEWVAIGNTIILMLHAASHNRQWLAFFLGPCLLYGLLLENGGIALGYFSELHYSLYLGPFPAPVATISGWVTVFYIVVWTMWEVKSLCPRLASSPAACTGVALAAALCFDLQVDPLATEVGFWEWHPSLARAWLGVPVLNYVAWSAAIAPFAWVIARHEIRCGLKPGEVTEAKHVKWLVARVPVVLGMSAVLFLGGMACIEGAFEGPTFNILRRFLGGL
jgi:uncharacterized membrane protein